MMVGEREIRTLKVVVVVLLLLFLLFDVYVPTSSHPLLFLDKGFVQIYLNESLVLILEICQESLVYESLHL